MKRRAVSLRELSFLLSFVTTVLYIFIRLQKFRHSNQKAGPDSGVFRLLGRTGSQKYKVLTFDTLHQYFAGHPLGHH